MLPGQWEKVLVAHSKGLSRKAAGTAPDPRKQHGLDVIRVAVPAPAAWFLRANQGKRN